MTERDLEIAKEWAFRHGGKSRGHGIESIVLRLVDDYRTMRRQEIRLLDKEAARYWEQYEYQAALKDEDERKPEENKEE